eukprot:TRINITY_DN620_c0_g2_i1.p1 TRINITY_DN620_c0_g2~~TRINITY_DN620_c0_g2_i1.p1  ORF type:complete len:306 (-),score=47.96 TRINITY_DN620_c0_g2_i1:176-1012(-)
MGVFAISIRDFACIVLSVGILLAEWNIGSNVSIEDQVKFIVAIGVWSALISTVALAPLDERLIKHAGFSFKCSAISAMQQVGLIAISLPLLAKMLILKSEWLTSPATPGLGLEQHVHLYCIAAMMKDFWLAEPLDAGFIFHHLMTIAGCGMCLVLPVGFGYATFNAAQAEGISVCYNLMHILPIIFDQWGRLERCLVQWTYMVLMVVSHVIIANIGIQFAYHLTVPTAPHGPWWTWWRTAYVVLSILIAAVRTLGQLMVAPKILFSDWKPELEEKKVD